jgi:hypothetical protein
MLPLNGLEALGDLGRPILITREQDVLGEIARTQIDVVLDLGVRHGDAAVGDRQSILLGEPFVRG